MVSSVGLTPRTLRTRLESKKKTSFVCFEMQHVLQTLHLLYMQPKHIKQKIKPVYLKPSHQNEAKIDDCNPKKRKMTSIQWRPTWVQHRSHTKRARPAWSHLHDILARSRERIAHKHGHNLVSTTKSKSKLRLKTKLAFF